MKKAIFQKALSVFLAVLIVLGTSPMLGIGSISANAAYSTGADSKVDYSDLIGKESLEGAEPEQVLTVLMDMLDAYLEREGETLSEAFEESTSLPFDFSSVEKLIASVYKYLESKPMGGDFDDLNISSLAGLKRENGDLKIIYALIQFIADNSDKIGDLLNGEFDFGRFFDIVFPDVTDESVEEIKQLIADFDPFKLICNELLGDEFFEGVSIDETLNTELNELINSYIKEINEVIYEFSVSFDSVIEGATYDDVEESPGGKDSVNASDNIEAALIFVDLCSEAIAGMNSDIIEVAEETTIEEIITGETATDEETTVEETTVEETTVEETTVEEIHEEETVDYIPVNIDIRTQNIYDIIETVIQTLFDNIYKTFTGENPGEGDIKKKIGTFVNAVLNEELTEELGITSTKQIDVLSDTLYNIIYDIVVGIFEDNQDTIDDFIENVNIGMKVVRYFYMDMFSEELAEEVEDESLISAIINSSELYEKFGIDVVTYNGITYFLTEEYISTETKNADGEVTGIEEKTVDHVFITYDIKDVSSMMLSAVDSIDEGLEEACPDESEPFTFNGKKYILLSDGLFEILSEKTDSIAFSTYHFEGYDTIAETLESEGTTVDNFGYAISVTTDTDKTTAEAWTCELPAYLYKGDFYCLHADGSVSKIMYADSVILDFVEMLNPDPELSFRDFDITGNYNTYSGFIAQLNHVVYVIADKFLTADTMTAINWQDGSNGKILDNLNSVVNFIFTNSCTKEWVRVLMEYIDEPSVTETVTELLKKANPTAEDVVIAVLNWLLKEGEYSDVYETVYDEDGNATGSVLKEHKQNYKYVKLDSLEEAVVLLVNSYVTPMAVKEGAEIRNYESLIYGEDGEMLSGKTDDYWKNLALDMLVDKLVELISVYDGELGLDFNLSFEDVTALKEKGWGWKEFLDEIVDWAFGFVYGLFPSMDDLSLERGVYDGNGAGYKISKFIKDMPTCLINGCEKSYGDETLAFDVSALFDILANAVFNLDIGKAIDIVSVNKSELNYFYDNSILDATIIMGQRLINGLFPGTIPDEVIENIDSLADFSTWIQILKNFSDSIGNRGDKLELFAVRIANIAIKSNSESDQFPKITCLEQLVAIFVYDEFADLIDNESAGEDSFVEQIYKGLMVDDDGELINGDDDYWKNILINMGVDVIVWAVNSITDKYFNSFPKTFIENAEQFVAEAGYDVEVTSAYNAWYLIKSIVNSGDEELREKASETFGIEYNGVFDWEYWFDDVMDWLISDLLHGFVPAADNLAGERFVTDANGGLYKLSVILNSLLPSEIINNCSKTYGAETIGFDLCTFIDNILSGILDLEINKITSLFYVNKSDANPLYANTANVAILAILQHLVNGLFPGTIEDDMIESIDIAVKKSTFVKFVQNFINSINTRKFWLVPSILHILSDYIGIDTGWCGCETHNFRKTAKKEIISSGSACYRLCNVWRCTECGYEMSTLDETELHAEHDDKDSDGYCDVCGYQLYSEGCDHKNTELRNAVKTGCTIPGYSGDIYCTDCEECIKNGTEIPALGHVDDNSDRICDICSAELDPENCEHTSTVIRNKVDATCTENGYTGDTYCVDCATKLSAGKQTDAIGHDFEETFTIDKDATCIESGSKSRHCTRCDAKTDVTSIDTGGHVFDETHVVVDGEERVSSSIDIAFVIDTTGSMGDDIARVKSDINTYLKTLADNDIDYRIALVDYRDFASRTNDSRDYAYHICLDFTDDALAISNAVNALSLGYGGDSEETVYSALTDGLKGLSWRDDAGKTAILMGDYGALDPEPETGYTLSSVTDVLKTEFSSPVTVFGIATGSSALSSFTKIAEATGGKAYSAASSLNITSLVTTIIKIMPTVIVVPGAKWQIRTAATCTEPGVEFRVCVKCKIYEETRAIEPLGHNYLVEETPATCTEDGKITYTCSRCGDSYSETVTSPGHIFDAADVTYHEATCTADAYTSSECTVCGLETRITYEGTALGHSYDDGVVVGSGGCTYKRIRFTCTRCSEYYETDDGSRIHDALELVSHSEPTCTEKGEDKWYCNTCQQYVTEETAALGHDYIYTDNGDEKTHTVNCSRCEYSAVENHKGRKCVCGYINTSELGVLLVEDYGAWSTSTNKNVLNELLSDGSLTFVDTAKTSELADIDFDGYAVILIANDQTTSSYNALASVKTKLDSYVYNGGSVIFGACDHGWQGGDIGFTLPGGVKKLNRYDRYNNIADSDHTIVTAALSDGVMLTDSDLHSTYCSHTYFDSSTFIDGTNVIFKDSEGNATLIEYNYGEGTVLASGLTWEYSAVYCSYAQFSPKGYDDLILYALKSSVSMKNMCLVRFFDKDGDLIKAQYVKKGDSATAPTAPEETGYSFTGWSTSFENVTVNTDVNALYEAEKYTLTLVSDIAGAELTGAGTYSYGEYTVISAGIPDGYQFAGWYDGETKVASYPESSVQITGNITLTAKFTDEAAHEHKYSLTYSKEATCFSDGVKVYTCSCGESYSEKIAQLTHKEVTTLIAADCINATVIVVTCEYCNTVLSQTKTEDALGHDFVLQSKEEATCIEYGIEHYKCSRCDATEDRYTDSFGEHTPGEEITVAPTCITAGSKTVKCTVCTKTLSYTELPATGIHTFTNYVSDKNATCLDDGTKTAKCDYCDETDTLTDEGSALGHSYKDVVTAPSCTAKGYTTHTCTRCEYTYVDTYTDAIGHSYGSCKSNNNGTHSEICSRCLNAITENCTYTDTVTPATASQQGYTTHTCTVCGYSYNDTYTDPTGGTEVYDETVVLFNSGNTSSKGCHYYGKNSSWTYSATPNYDAASKTNGGYDIYANHDYSPVTQVGTSFTVKSDITEDAKLNLNCYDVDENSGERDYLYLVDETDNKEYKLSGYLSGMNEQWNSTSFTVPAEYLIKNHTYHIKLNVSVKDWHVFVRTAEIELTGWTSPLAGAELSAEISGNTVSTSLYVKTLKTAELTLEYKAVCGMQQYGSAFATVTGTTSGVTLPVDIELESGAPAGTYQITVYIKETETGNPLNSVTATVSKGSKYSVNYHSNGGTNTVPTDAAAYESGATVNVLFTDIPSRTGYTFMGWATSASASTPAYTSDGTKTFTMGSKDVDLYAVWSDTACSHSYSATVTTPATCTTPGVMTYTCIYCGYSYTESISSEHNYELYDTVPATCTVDGKNIYKCTNCGDTYEEVITGGHNYVPEITKKATKTESGTITYICSKCGDFYTEEYTIKIGDVLLVQDIPSWQTSSDTDLLTQLAADGKIAEWNKVASSVLIDMDISGYDVIMIANDQVDSTYTNLAACNNKLTQFASDGGVVIYGACDNGWVDGDISYALPGGAIKKNYYSHNNYILDYTSPVVTGKLSDGTGITNEILEGNFCSHSYFEASSLPENAHVILADGNGNATLAEYTIGKGRVIVSGLTWEFYYERDYSNFEKTYSENVYDDLVLYAMSCCYYVECNHNEKTVTKEATCTENGYIRTVCTECEKIFSEEIIPALGHDASGDYVVVKKATCTEDGEKALYCSRCGFGIVSDVVIPAKGHSWGEWTEVTAPTCTTTGESIRYCQNEADDSYEKCSESETRIDAALGHDYEITYTPNTCTTAGSVIVKCKRCEFSESADLTVISHNYTTIVVEPTCLKDGYTRHICVNCGDEYTDTVVPATGHKAAKAVKENVFNASCTRNGSCDEVVYCSVCRTELSREEKVIEKYGHSFTNYISDGNATCTTDGTKTAVCDNCDKTSTIADEGSAKGHSFTNYISDGNATCTTDGTKTAKCDNCDATSTITDEGSAKGHTEVTDKAVAATCTATGLTEGKHCSVCETVLVEQKAVPALGHSFTNYISDGNATCTTDGTKTAKCDNCDATSTITDEGSAKGHTEVTDKAVAATCTATGLTEGKHCSVCKAVLVEQKAVPALGHKFDSGKITTAATCAKTGVKTYTCTVCQATKTETIAKTTEHTWNDGVITTSATCAKTGVKTYTCTVCKATKTETVAKLTTHTCNDVVTAATLTKAGKIQSKCSVCGKVVKTTAIAKIKSVALIKSDVTYTGKAQKVAVKVTDSNGKTVASSNYTVSYKNNTNVGKATVTVKFKGNYSGTKTLTFTISPKATTLSKVTSPKKATAKVTVKKQATQTTGYEIQYSTSAKFTEATTKTVKITSAKTLTKTISKLTSGKTYYFRVRTYKTVSKVDYTSAWSTSVKAKIK